MYGTFHLLVLKAICGSFGALVSKWHVTRKRIPHRAKRNEIWDSGVGVVGICIWGTFDVCHRAKRVWTFESWVVIICILLWAHGLHLLFFPVWPVCGVGVCLDRLPSIPKKTACFRWLLGKPRAVSRDRSSLIFSGFPNSAVVSVHLTGGVVERIRLWCSDLQCLRGLILYFRKLTHFSGKVGFACLASVGASDRQLWFDSRPGRVTAGMLYQAAILASETDVRENRKIQQDCIRML